VITHVARTRNASGRVRVRGSGRKRVIDDSFIGVPTRVLYAGQPYGLP
jgi:hypothetical protein